MHFLHSYTRGYIAIEEDEEEEEETKQDEESSEQNTGNVTNGVYNGAGRFTRDEYRWLMLNRSVQCANKIGV